jgi:hypothetical protein
MYCGPNLKTLKFNPQNLLPVFRARIYYSNNLIYTIIDPFNWLIINNTINGDISLVGENNDACKKQTQIYTFQQSENTFLSRCWAGTYTSLLSNINKQYIYTTVDLNPPEEGAVFCAINAINQLLDLGILTNNT